MLFRSPGLPEDHGSHGELRHRIPLGPEKGFPKGGQLLSLDAAQFEGAEYASEETPETKMEREMDTERISQALDGLSEVQRRRILMLAEGKSVNEIARKEGAMHQILIAPV